MYFCHPSVLACVKLCGYRQQRDSFTGPKEKVSFDISNGQIYVEKFEEKIVFRRIFARKMYTYEQKQAYGCLLILIYLSVKAIS